MSRSWYSWWTFAGGEGDRHRWLKLGPVTLVWGPFLFRHSGIAIEVHFLNRMLWCNY